MKLNKKLQNIANESLEIYNNEEFLTELLNMVKTPVIIEKPFKLNKAVVSGVALGLVLVVAVPIIIRAATGLNQTEVPKSTSVQTSNSTQNPPSSVPTGSTETSKSDDYINNAEIPSFTCEILSKQMEFDIDNATLTFAFGGLYYAGIEYEHQNRYNIPSFDLYFENNEGDKILYKNVEENLVSEKYNTKWILREDYRLDHIEYNYSEEITVPKQLFTQESGRIKFYICGTDINGVFTSIDGSDYCKIAHVGFDYNIKDGKVIFSNIDKGW